MPKKSSKKQIPPLDTEKQVDDWLQKADLTDYFSGEEFSKVRFEKLEKKLVDEAYEEALKTQPVTLRLSLALIQKLKLLAIQKGLAYQTLAKILLQEQVNKSLTR